MSLLGGREVHPINVRVGGSCKTPTTQELQSLVPDLQWAVEAAESTARWVTGFTFPEFEPDYEFVALQHPQEYAINEGRLVSNKVLQQICIELGVAEYWDDWG